MAERKTPTIYIDADACPVVRQTLAVARKAGLPCVVAGDVNHNLEAHIRRNDPREPREGFWVRTLGVTSGPDSADFAIVCELEPEDVVVTQDIGLAQMALGRGAHAIDVRGRVFDSRTIDMLLLVRHATKEELRDRRRRGKPRVEAHKPIDEEARARFERRFEDFLHELGLL